MEVNQKFTPDPSLKLMDQVRQVLRYYHYAYRTEETYYRWIVQSIQEAALSSDIIFKNQGFKKQ